MLLLRAGYFFIVDRFRERQPPRLRSNCRVAAPISTISRRYLGGTRALRINATMLQNMCPAVPIFGDNELDTHADTCVLGRNFIVTQYTGRECDVVPYSDSYEAVTGVPIVSGATAWTDSESGETWIIFIHEALWMAQSMPNSLLNPNQLRAYGIDVEDNPSRGPLYIENSTDDIRVPLRMAGTNILFESRTPTQEELDTCRKVHFSSSHEWNPASAHDKFAQIAVATVSTTATDRARYDDTYYDEEIYNPDTFSRRLIHSVQVSLPSVRAVDAILSDTTIPPTFVSEDRRADVSPQTLSDRWMIGLKQAQLTLKNTTQRYIRSALLPLARRYKADRIFHLPRLQGEWFTDTVFGRVKSKDGNTCGQIFANESYFATFYPMDTKAKAGDALRVFCAEFGVPEESRP